MSNRQMGRHWGEGPGAASQKSVERGLFLLLPRHDAEVQESLFARRDGNLSLAADTYRRGRNPQVEIPIAFYDQGPKLSVGALALLGLAGRRVRKSGRLGLTRPAPWVELKRRW